MPFIPTEKQLFKNKYRIKSTRLKHWDYSSNGAYYVTICTKDREQFFCEIVNGKMKLSQIGKIVEYEWKQTCEIRKNVKLDEYVVMPDHFHGILFIENALHPVETPRRGVSTRHILNPPHNPEWKPNSLGSIICQFKSICTKRIYAIGFPDFAWQTRFHESIVRNEKHLNAIREYIINNPLKFELDKNLHLDFYAI